MKIPHWIRLVVAMALVAVSAAACSKSAQTYLERGNAQFEKGNVDAAVLEYRNAVSKDAMFAPARLKLAEAYLKQGNIAGALGESVRAADLLPNDADAQLKAGSLLLLARRAEDAKARADKALAKAPKNVDALVLRANAMAGLRDLDGALKEMEQALSLDPRSSFQTNLGFIQAARGQTARGRGRVPAGRRHRFEVGDRPGRAGAVSCGAREIWQAPRRHSRPRWPSSPPTCCRIARSPRSISGRPVPRRPSPTSRRWSRSPAPWRRSCHWSTTTWG